MQLTSEEKLFWLSYIEAKLGLVLPSIQQRRFETRIVERMRVYNSTSDEYFKKIKSDDTEWQHLIDELIIPETSFFRHQPSFDLVKSHLQEKSSTSHLWSVGCSTGEEAWSLAIVADQVSQAYRVMATDVSMTSIQTAQIGRYAHRKVERMDSSITKKYFDVLAENNGQSDYLIKEALRSKVSFYRHNLVSDKRLPFREIDVIFCQNVLIYFRNFVQRDILNQLVKSLSVGGILVMGPAEASSWQHPHMTRVNFAGTLAYKRIKE